MFVPAGKQSPAAQAAEGVASPRQRSGSTIGDPAVPSTALPHLDRLLEGRPGQELAIWRLYRRDPEFRAVCEDLEAVRRALENWQSVDPPLPGRVAECQNMLAELEAEALEFLDQRDDRRGTS
ncbi:MAG: hypothetical protein R3D25_11190 [Geminicoccaceae bacterium]